MSYRRKNGGSLIDDSQYRDRSNRSFDFNATRHDKYVRGSRNTLEYQPYKSNDRMFITASPRKESPGYYYDSYGSYGYYSDYYSSVTHGYSSEIYSTNDTGADELPSVHFDSEDESYQSKSISKTYESPQKKPQQPQNVNIPIFRFPAESKSSKDKSAKDKKSKKSSNRSKAPPIPETITYTTDTTTTTQQKEKKPDLLSPAPGFILQLDTPSELDHTEYLKQIRPRNVVSRKPPPILQEQEQKKNKSHIQSYEAPLQKAAEAYRKAALEEKERIKKLEEEKAKQKAEREKLLQQQNQQHSKTTPIIPKIENIIKNTEKLSDELPKPKKTKKSQVVTLDIVPDNKLLISKEEAPKSMDQTAKTPKPKKKKGKKARKQSEDPIVIFNDSESIQSIQTLQSSNQSVKSAQTVQSAKTQPPIHKQNPPQLVIETNDQKTEEIHLNLIKIDTHSEATVPPSIQPQPTNPEPAITEKVALNNRSGLALDKIMNEEKDELDDDSFFKESESHKKLVDEDDVIDIDSGSPFKFQDKALPPYYSPQPTNDSMATETLSTGGTNIAVAEIETPDTTRAGNISLVNDTISEMPSTISLASKADATEFTNEELANASKDIDAKSLFIIKIGDNGKKEDNKKSFVSLSGYQKRSHHNSKKKHTKSDTFDSPDQPARTSGSIEALNSKISEKEAPPRRKSYEEPDESLSVNLDELIRGYKERKKEKEMQEKKKQNIVVSLDSEEDAILQSITADSIGAPKSARVIAVNPFRKVEEQNLTVDNNKSDAKSHKSHRSRKKHSISEEELKPPATLASVAPTNLPDDGISAFRWENYPETVPTVTKSQLLQNHDSLIPAVPNPSEPVKGWLKFQVGFIPMSDNSQQIQKAAELFDFESLLKQMRKE